MLTKVGAQFTGWLSNTGTTRFTEPRLGRTWRHCRWYAGSILNSVTPCILFKERKKKEGTLVESCWTVWWIMRVRNFSLSSVYYLVIWVTEGEKSLQLSFSDLLFVLFFSINCNYWNWLFCKYNVDIKEWIFLDYI